MRQQALQKRKNEIKNKFSTSYNQFKDFKGKKYTGMKAGRSHKWYYDKGEWKEKKVTPDKWEFTYAVGKRRAGYAPEGSGVPIGTEYHWYILADQTVRKNDANSYTTTMTGFKYKLAHKLADKEKWSSTTDLQRLKLIAFLEESISHLKSEVSISEEPLTP
jgi:hypothetical protein